MKQQIAHFNKIIIKFLILAVIYSQFMVSGLFINSLLSSISRGDFYPSFLVEAIPYYIYLSGYALTIVVYSLFVFLFLDLLFILLFKINSALNNKLDKLVKNFGTLFSFLKHFNKYIAFYFLITFSFLIFIIFGLYLPIWIYESIFKIPAFFTPKDALEAFFNLKSAIVLGIPGFMIFLFLSLVVKLLFKRELKIDKFRVDLINLIKKT